MAFQSITRPRASSFPVPYLLYPLPRTQFSLSAGCQRAFRLWGWSWARWKGSGWLGQAVGRGWGREQKPAWDWERRTEGFRVREAWWEGGNGAFIFSNILYCKYQSQQINFIMLKSRLTAVPMSPSADSCNNFTTAKQKEVRNRFAELLEQDRPVIPEPPQELIPDQEEVAMVRQAHEEGVSSPRRSMVRQIEIWEDVQMMEEPVQRPIHLRTISEDYYNESVAAKTTVFLAKMRDLLHSHHQHILAKRRHIVETVLKSIRNQWTATRQQLVDLVNAWSREGEQREVAHFLEVGELQVSGQLMEIESKIEMKREELEIDGMRVEQMRREQKVIDEEEIVERSYAIKRVLKQIWEKNYECQIGELTEEAARISAAVDPTAYNYSLFPIEVNTLHLQIDRLFLNSNRITASQSIQEEQNKLKEAKEAKEREAREAREARQAREKQLEYLASTIKKEEQHEKRVLQSLMSERVKELEVLRSRRQVEWQQLLQKTLRKGE